MLTNYEELEKLSDLKDKGILTEEEFNEKKREILEGGGSIRNQISQNSNEIHQTPFEKLKNNLKHPKIKEIEMDKKGNVVIKTSLNRHICILDANGKLKKIQTGVNPDKIILVLLLTIIVAFIQWQERKEIEPLINNVLN